MSMLIQSNESRGAVASSDFDKRWIFFDWNRIEGRLEKKKRPENVFSSDEDSKIVDDVDNEISREDWQPT